MNALIFGANGQDGYYLCECCRADGIDPIGVSRSGDWLRGDVSDYSQVERLVKSYKPDFIFHLAATSNTRHDAWLENHQSISTGTLNIFESVKNHSPDSRVFITGSGVQFKNTGRPISENDTFFPNNPYSVARIHSVYATRYYRSLGLRAYVGYLFHHESPLRKSYHLSQSIACLARQVAEGRSQRLPLGDTSVMKEYTFAGDVARGILTLVRQQSVFEAAIGSGVDHSVEEWLNACFAVNNHDWRPFVQFREDFSPEYKRLVSDPATIRALGWSPRVSFDELAQMMVGHSTGASA
jgi:GDPmannose 4,6-dehydratase